MDIGHINIESAANDFADHFASLVEALSRLGVHQHVLVADTATAGRLSDRHNVTVGPIVESPVSAYCLMPNIDLVHAHSIKGGQSALLLLLNRSTPFVLTDRDETGASRNPVNRSVYRRAASLLCHSGAAAESLIKKMPKAIVDVVPDIGLERPIDAVDKRGSRAASEHLKIYQRAVDMWRVPELRL